MEPKRKKITLFIPEDLLQKAQKHTGQGITPTIRQALELLAAKPVYDEIRKMRGKYQFKIDLDKLREDR